MVKYTKIGIQDDRREIQEDSGDLEEDGGEIEKKRVTKSEEDRGELYGGKQSKEGTRKTEERTQR